MMVLVSIFYISHPPPIDSWTDATGIHIAFFPTLFPCHFIDSISPKLKMTHYNRVIKQANHMNPDTLQVIVLDYLNVDSILKTLALIYK